MSCECEVEVEVGNAGQASVLKLLLAINAVMFLVESVTGIVAQSAGLVADSLDMFADAAVYGIGLYAVGRSALHKARAAYLSGVFQCLLGVGVIVEVGHRFVAGSEPMSLLMVGMGGLALVANVSCLALLSRYRNGEVHMRASWIFSTNDVLANLGVIIAGALVAWTASPVPDLVIGCGIAVLVIRGGLHILSEARRELANERIPTPTPGRCPPMPTLTPEHGKSTLYKELK